MHTSAEKTTDFGPPATLRVCILRNPEVTQERIDQIIASVNEEFSPFGITVVVPWVRDWPRPGFRPDTIFQDIVTHPLEAPCDRLVGLVHRHVGDFLVSIVASEILGMVDTSTHTHGWVAATYASPNQLVMNPSYVAEHEFYHLLGCPHDVTLTDCYPRIAAIKREALHTDDFFPGVTLSGEFLTTRAAVNDVFREGRAVIIDFSPVAHPHGKSADAERPPYLMFPDQPSGTTSGSQTITLHNHFTKPVQIRGISLAGVDVQDYSEVNDCGDHIRARHSCVINVAFHPTSPGPKSATITVNVDVGSKEVATALSGNGT